MTGKEISEIIWLQRKILIKNMCNDSDLVVYLDFESLVKIASECNTNFHINARCETIFGMKIYRVDTKDTHINVCVKMKSTQ